MERHVNKISFDPKKKILKVVYDEQNNENESKEIVFRGYEAPLDTFLDALQSLHVDTLAICQLPDEWGFGLIVRSVSITWTDGIMGAVITNLKTLETSTAPMVVNTPHLPSEPYNDEFDSPTLPNGCKGRILKLIEEAERYINGDRAERQEKLRLVS